VARSETKGDGSPPLTGIWRERSEGAQKCCVYGTDLRGAGLRASAKDVARALAWLIAAGRGLVTVVVWRSRASARRGLSERSERGGRTSDAGGWVSVRGGGGKDPSSRP